MAGQESAVIPHPQEEDAESKPLLDTPMSPEDTKKEKRRIMKNVFLVSFAFFLNYNSFSGLSRLQSSLNGSMGIITMSFIHITRIPSCLILPNVVIGLLRHKWTIPLGLTFYILWMAANGHAMWGTLAPASILVGMASSFTWTALSSYLSISAERYAKIANETHSTVISHFFGIFYFMYNLAGMTGAAISSAILPAPKAQVSQSALELCGAKDCPWNNVTINPNEERPDETIVWKLVGIYVGIACFALFLVSIFVDNLPKQKSEQVEESKCKKIGKLVFGTAKHLTHKKQIVLIPATAYMGMSKAVFNAEFTKSYITCALGMWKVGLVVMVFAFVNSAFSVIGGRIVKYTGRVPVCTVGFIVDIVLVTFLINWEPHPDQEYLFYIVAALWGVKEAILLTQINALYGVTFPKSTDPAYASYRLYESLGFAVAYNYSPYLCTSVKLYILAGGLGSAILSYYVIENWNRLSNKKPETT